MSGVSLSLMLLFRSIELH